MSKKREATLKYPYILTGVFLIFAFSLFVLFPGTRGYENIQEAKYQLFLLLFGGYLLLMFLFSAEMLLIKRLKLPPIKSLWNNFSIVQRLVFLYWVCTVLSAIFSPYFPHSVLGISRNEGLLTITIYCWCFLCVSSFAKPKQYLIWVSGAALSIFSVIALLQMQGHNPFGLYPAGYSYFDADVAYSGVYLSTVGNAGLVAAILCLTFPLFLTLLLRDFRKWKVLLIPTIFSFVTMMQMNVQASIIALLVGLPIIISAVSPVNEQKRKWLWIGVAVLFAAAFIWIYAGSHSPDSTFYELCEILHGNWDPDFGSGRILIWQSVISRLPQNMLFGTGPDTMLAAQIYLGSSPVDVAHNEYLNVLFHQGLLSLLPYLAALVASAVHWFKLSPRNPWIAALGAGILCYSIQAFFSFSMCPSAGLFWIVWALFEGAVCKEVTL